ncbi:MAG TPA: MerR family transcriptional regulator [Dinghuibacter sp.]|jgi:DNA-binding transcriptional MerR regulator|uniref:MerR family transcriptional regulator n=1 Tax=Dinghuibacter sp. TaxID=2024697 RepID=UPI002C2CAF1E|nr:MerR family transcriptional regulator [Dinghuibacter sp.]HTJ13258.1 MerR family transcriptional regulator [Dinghuibacter sp.]
MRIGELSRRSGFSRDTIRYYEKMGLIQLRDCRLHRTSSKDYPESVLRRLVAIREIKRYGFTLQETLGMIVLFEEGVLEPERGIRFVQRKIERIDRQIGALQEARGRLQEIVAHGADGRCPLAGVLEAMA